jgi:hypothetical protein
VLQRFAGSISLALINIEKPPMVGNKERSPLLPTIGLFSLSANAKELEPAKRSQIDLAQTNSRA